jgi:hypothetical protein
MVSVITHIHSIASNQLNRVEQLLSLLAQQQPSIFRAAGQWQRAAVLDPLLACLHLQYVVHGVLQRGSRGYAMHVAAVDAGAVQLRVLQMLGADLDLAYTKQEGTSPPIQTTPLMMACTSVGGAGRCGPPTVGQQESQLQQQEQWQPHSVLMENLKWGKSREPDVAGEGGSYTAIVQRRLGVVKLLVEAGASLTFR